MTCFAPIVQTLEKKHLNVGGSYVDADGIYHVYVRVPGNRFLPFDLPNPDQLEYVFMPHINDANIGISRAKAIGDVPLHRQGASSVLLNHSSSR